MPELVGGNLALLLLLLTAALLAGIRAARRGRGTGLRRLAGIDAIVDAVGRAAETGRPCFYVPGVRDLDDVQTVASLSILGSVAEEAARLDARLVVPTDRSLVMAAAREVTRQAYATAGRLDAWRPDMVGYVSDEQFAFVARVDGMIERERPAAVLLLGSFYAESLLLAEAGNRAGARQVAGTAGWHQLPFLIAACDHVLIGEELFAASAYLTGDPDLVGSLRGQDRGKDLALALAALGALLSTLAVLADWPPLAAARRALLGLLNVE